MSETRDAVFGSKCNNSQLSYYHHQPDVDSNQHILYKHQQTVAARTKKIIFHQKSFTF